MRKKHHYRLKLSTTKISSQDTINFPCHVIAINQWFTKTSLLKIIFVFAKIFTSKRDWVLKKISPVSLIEHFFQRSLIAGSIVSIGRKKLPLMLIKILESPKLVNVLFVNREKKPPEKRNDSKSRIYGKKKSCQRNCSKRNSLNSGKLKGSPVHNGISIYVK